MLGTSSLAPYSSGEYHGNMNVGKHLVAPPRSCMFENMDMPHAENPPNSLKIYIYICLYMSIETNWILRSDH